MSPIVRSVNVGAAAPNPASPERPTGIGKVPVDSIELRAPGPKHGGLGSGVVDDFIGDQRHHGGNTQAVYAVAREELDHWGRELGRELPDGMFGENLTTLGLDVDESLVGDLWRIGEEVLLRVSGPRVPCSTFAARMGERGWVRRFTARGRTGAYLAVVRPGTIRRGDELVLVDRPDHDVTVPMFFRAWMGDLRLAEHVLASGALPPEEQDELAEKVAARIGR